MTDNNKAALGPKGVAVADALGRGLPGVFSPVSAWLTLLDGWWWDDYERAPPPCPTITDATAEDVGADLVGRPSYLTSAVVDALLAELRRTRGERDEAMKARDEAFAALDLCDLEYVMCGNCDCVVRDAELTKACDEADRVLRRWGRR